MDHIDITNEAKSSVLGDELEQYTIHITRDQAHFINEQTKKRRALGIRGISFSELVRELIDSGFTDVVKTTEALQSMRGPRP
jgi:hypothetical protein